MELKWTKAEDGLPTETGWYLTYSPNYWRANSFTNREKCEGLVFAKFTISKNGNRGWSIETPMNSNIVKAWMPLPIPEWADPYHDVPFNSTPGYPYAKFLDEQRRLESEKAT